MSQTRVEELLEQIADAVEELLDEVELSEENIVRDLRRAVNHTTEQLR